MTLDELKALLKSGAITQEQFDSMVKAMGLDENEPEPEDEEPEADDKDDSKAEPFDMEKIEKLIQQRVDRQMAAERKKNVDLKKQLERLQKAKMTDEELQQIELSNKEKDIEEREKALKEQMNRLYAQKVLKKEGLDDGSEDSLAIVDFVLGGDETEIDERVKSFKTLFNKAVEKAVNAEVEKRFKDAARSPKKGSVLNNGVNPYTKEQFSLTEQMRIEAENPELAKQLEAAAKIK